MSFHKVETLAEAKRQAEAINGCAWSNGAHAHFVSATQAEGMRELRYRSDSMAVMLVQSFEPILLPEPYDGR